MVAADPRLILRDEELDGGLLVWKIHQRIRRELLPERRTVVEFDFTGPRARRVWLLLEPREVSVCVTPPGFEADLVLRSDLAAFYRVWLGQVSYGTALRCGALTVAGPRALARQLPRWLAWSPMASFIRASSCSSTGFPSFRTIPTIPHIGNVYYGILKIL